MAGDRKRLFVDMDGTLAQFQQVDELETLYEKGYFENLAPLNNVVSAVKNIIYEQPDIDVYILSAYLSDSEYALAEKNTWLDMYLPEIPYDKRIFPPCGCDKKDYIPDGIRNTDFLLDDYTHNLTLWQPPARGIKILNGINHTRGSWENDRIRYDKSPSELSNNIVSIMLHDDMIFDDKPNYTNVKDKKNIAIESTIDYTNIDDGFVQGSADDDIQNADGSYGKPVDFYRLVVVGDDGMVKRYDDRVFDSNLLAVTAAMNLQDYLLVDYDTIVHDASRASGMEYIRSLIEPMPKDGVTIKGHTGTWHVIDQAQIDDIEYRLFEPDTYGDAVGCVITNIRNEVVLDNVFNSFDDLREYFDSISYDDDMVYSTLSVGQVYRNDDLRRYLAKERNEAVVYSSDYVFDDTEDCDVIEILGIDDDVLTTNFGESEREFFSQKVFTGDYKRLPELEHVPVDRKVVLDNLVFDDDGYLHFDAVVDERSLQGLFRVHDPVNGDSMRIVSIDNGFVHESIDAEWGDIEKELTDYATKFQMLSDYGNNVDLRIRMNQLVRLYEELTVIDVSKRIFLSFDDSSASIINDGVSHDRFFTSYCNALNALCIKHDDLMSDSYKDSGDITNNMFYRTGLHDIVHREYNEKRAFTPTAEQHSLLNALYSGVMTCLKYPYDVALQNDMRLKFADYAHELDKLKVPFAVQNAVSAAAEYRDNWSRYNNIVLNDIYANGYKPQLYFSLSINDSYNLEYHVHANPRFDGTNARMFVQAYGKDSEGIGLIPQDIVFFGNIRDSRYVSDMLNNGTMSVADVHVMSENILSKWGDNFVFYATDELSDSGNFEYFNNINDALKAYMSFPDNDMKALGYWRSMQSGLGGVLVQYDTDLNNHVVLWDNPSVDFTDVKNSQLVYALKSIDDALHNEHPTIDNNIKAVNKMDYVMPENGVNQDAKEALREKLTNGIQSFLETDTFKNWLNSCGKLFFNNYSFQNSLLVWLQKPDASHTMGYEGWKDFGRQVSQGTQGAKIFMPVMASESKKGGLYSTINWNLNEQFNKDPSLKLAVYRLGLSNLEFTKQRDNGLFGLRNNGKEVMHFKSVDDCKKFIDTSVLNKAVVGYRVGTVFDVKDTYAPDHLWVKRGYVKEELALDDMGNPQKNKKGEFKIVNTSERQSRLVTNLELLIPEKDPDKMLVLLSVLKSVSEKKDVPVYFTARADDDFLAQNDKCKGYYHKSDIASNDICYIRVCDDLPLTEKVAVLIHEMAHADLHGSLDKLETSLGEKADLSMREIQAEATAYAVASRFGIETDIHSFGYMAVYSKGYELQNLQKSIEVIFKESQALLNDITTELDLQGYNLDVSKINDTVLDVDSVNALCSKYIRYALEKSDEVVYIKKELADMFDRANNDDLRNVLNSQGSILSARMEDLLTIKNAVERFESCSDRLDQDSCIDIIEAAKSRIESSILCMNNLSEEYVVLLGNDKENLANQFIADRERVLNDIVNDHPSLLLSPENREYISSSLYVKRDVSYLLNIDVNAFVDNIAARVSAIDDVKANNGAFVEIVSCEQWTDKPIFEKGTLLHPKIVDDIIQQAEFQYLRLKSQALETGEVFPDTACTMTLYAPTSNGLSSLTYQLDIGVHKTFHDHMNDLNVRGKEKKEVISAVADALGERGVKDNYLTPDMISERSITTRGMNREDWDSVISIERTKRTVDKLQNTPDKDTQSNSKANNEHDK